MTDAEVGIVLIGCAVLALGATIELQRRRVARLEARLDLAEVTLNLSSGVHTVHRGCMEALDKRLDHHAQAINQIAAHPACAPALGARIARIEMMLLPQSWDAPAGQLAAKTPGGDT